MILEEAGFREHSHTADWELEVWAPDFELLCVYAAQGMYSLSSTQLGAHPRVSRTFELTAHDDESLLVSFLEELLYFVEMESLGFDSFYLDIADLTLQAEVFGAPIASQAKEIKAVTYHNLAIRDTERGLNVKIVFDV